MDLNVDKNIIDALIREGSRRYQEGNFAKAATLYGIVVDVTGDRIVNRWHRDALQKLEATRRGTA